MYNMVNTMIEVSRWSYGSTKQRHLRRIREGLLKEMMPELSIRVNKGKAEERAGRAFPSEGKEGVWTQGWNSKQFDDAGT